MDLPAVDREPGLVEGLLPGDHVGIDGIDERAVEVEDECAHGGGIVIPLRRDREPRSASFRIAPITAGFFSKGCNLMSSVLALYTLLHVVLSLVGIFSGLLVVGGFVAGKR